MDNKCPYIATDQTAVIIFSVLYAGNCAGKVEPRSKVPLAHQKVKKKKKNFSCSNLPSNAADCWSVCLGYHTISQ